MKFDLIIINVKPQKMAVRHAKAENDLEIVKYVPNKKHSYKHLRGTRIYVHGVH